MPAPRAHYRTAPRSRGARSGDTDPRPGEDPSRGGQKAFASDPGGMKSTERPETENVPAEERCQPGADVHQPVRGSEPTSDGKRAGDAKLHGEDRPAFKTRS